jgi:hypothetical protein
MQSAKSIILGDFYLLRHITQYIPTPLRCRAAATNRDFNRQAKDPVLWEQDVKRLSQMPEYTGIKFDVHRPPYVLIGRAFRGYCYACGDWAEALASPTGRLPFERNTGAYLGSASWDLSENKTFGMPSGHRHRYYLGDRSLCTQCSRTPYAWVGFAETLNDVPHYINVETNARFIAAFDCYVFSELPRPADVSPSLPLPRGVTVLETVSEEEAVYASLRRTGTVWERLVSKVCRYAGVAVCGLVSSVLFVSPWGFIIVAMKCTPGLAFVFVALPFS